MLNLTTMTEDTFSKLAFIFLGWLLGMLSPVIVDAIKRRRENALGRTAILTELNELAGMLATAIYGARVRNGTVDRKFLEWFKNILECHATTPDLEKFIPSLRTQLSWTDEELKAVARHTSSDEGKGTMLQHYPVPLLDARVSALWSFDASFQRQLLEIRRNVAILDDVVDRSRKYFDLTFTNLGEQNGRLVEENLVQTYGFYAERATIIVEQIANLKGGSQ